MQSEQQDSNLQGHAPSCPCSNADERGCFLISAETGKCVSCLCDMTANADMQHTVGERRHLPECPAPLCDWGNPSAECMGYEDCHHLCCCDALRACEQRVRLEDDDYAYVAAQSESEGRWRGWSEALDAAREAVAKEAERGPLYSVRNSGDAQQGWDAMSRHALAAIDALRDQPADQTGYEVPNVRHLAADLITEYAEARHQPHGARYDCGRCDLTAALRAAAHDIRSST